MGLIWLALLVPAALLALMIAMDHLERWHTSETLADQINRYLSESATPDLVEAEVSDLLQRSLAHIAPGLRQ